MISAASKLRCTQRTVLTAPPPKCCATALAMDGFSATQSILCGGMTAVELSVADRSHLSAVCLQSVCSLYVVCLQSTGTTNQSLNPSINGSRREVLACCCVPRRMCVGRRVDKGERVASQGRRALPRSISAAGKMQSGMRDRLQCLQHCIMTTTKLPP